MAGRHTAGLVASEICVTERVQTHNSQLNIVLWVLSCQELSKHGMFLFEIKTILLFPNMASLCQTFQNLYSFYGQYFLCVKFSKCSCKVFLWTCLASTHRVSVSRWWVWNPPPQHTHTHLRLCGAPCVGGVPDPEAADWLEERRALPSLVREGVDAAAHSFICRGKRLSINEVVKGGNICGSGEGKGFHWKRLFDWLGSLLLLTEFLRWPTGARQNEDHHWHWRVGRTQIPRQMWVFFPNFIPLRWRAFSFQSDQRWEDHFDEQTN